MMNGFLRWLMASDDEPNWRARLAALEPPIIDGEPREPTLRVLYAKADGRERLERMSDERR